MSERDTTIDAGRGFAAARVSEVRELGAVLVAGVLIGLGILALVHGGYLYVEFHRPASGIPTYWLSRSIFWCIYGGVALSSGIAVLSWVLGSGD